MKKYQLPDFLLLFKVNQEQYEKWLRNRASAHVRRDRRRKYKETSREKYMGAIHKAVEFSHGLDEYTGEELNWKLLGEYDNIKSEKDRKKYRRTLALKPTIDQVSHGRGVTFKICAWRTNDAKSDLSYRDFVELCKKVLKVANKKRLEKTDKGEFSR